MKLSGEFNGNQAESQKKKIQTKFFFLLLPIFHRTLYLREAAGCCLYTFIRLLLSWL